MSKHESPHKVKLGDNYQYPIKGRVEVSYKLEFGKSLKMGAVLYVPGLKKNLMFISSLYTKGMRVKFIDGQVLMLPEGNTIYHATLIGEED